MDLRKLLVLLLRVRRTSERNADEIDGAIIEVERQQDIARRLRKLEIDMKVQRGRR